MIAKPKCAKDKLVLALDVNTMEEARELVHELRDYVGIFKVGLQLYTSVGPDIIKMIQDEGGEIFFDGKFHDIPNTVAKASANLVKHGVTFFNIHTTGGSKMISTCLKLARETARSCGLPKPTVLGVTLLTSFGQKTLTEELLINRNIDDYVGQLAKVAKESGLDGIIASATDVPKIKKACGNDFLILCPAIRPTWSVVNDQIRVVTPADAIRAGVDFLVVGRPITSAKDRVSAAKLVLDEMEEAILATS
ncbi:MAG: orotidine-5'-phosphate decarboxylase [Candidatus Gastranaerophilales bacterium]|jgi:orotidine-5'-phosphate decarboxylase|nr:orotidine-5'-phosphate decarboxylase [Candidatus Gastranaerophilales bacterium]